jgi:AraC-like DNA-binding protein
MKFDRNFEQLKLWQVPYLENLELLHGSGVTYDYPRHMHEEYCIVLMIRGKEVTNCRGETHTALPGDILLIDAEEVHSSQSFDTEFKVFKVRQNTFKGIAADILGYTAKTPYFSEFIIQDKKLYRLFLNLFGKLIGNVSRLEQESDLVSVIGRLLERQDKNRPNFETFGKESYRVKSARDYLKSHYAENVSLSALASIAGLSRFYLLRVFRNQMGVPPHEYQTQVRVARARKLLRSGHSILEAALETGFFDQSHFSRNFKRITGRTPGQYLSESNIVQDTAE